MLFKKQKQNSNKENENTNKNRKEHCYRTNDLVLRKINVRSKYDRYYEGPYKITKIKNHNVLELEGPDTIIQTNLKQFLPVKDGEHDVF